MMHWDRRQGGLTPSVIPNPPPTFPLRGPFEFAFQVPWRKLVAISKVRIIRGGDKCKTLGKSESRRE